MYPILFIGFLLFGPGSCLPPVQQNNSTLLLTRKVQSIESSSDGCDELHDKVDKMSEMLETIYNMGVKRHTSCASLFDAGYDESGVYTIRPPDLAPMEVYCDMMTKGGGWTVIQRRTSKEVDFYKTWAEYRHFFGDVEGNYWLGLEAIHQLTKYRHVELYVKLQDFDRDFYYARYSHFGVESEESKYRLNVFGYSGTAGDSLSWSNGMPFTTRDRDNDGNHGNCAVNQKGAWWYNNCGWANINSIYDNMKTTGWHTNHWYTIKSSPESLKSTEMMIRPSGF